MNIDFWGGVKNYPVPVGFAVPPGQRLPDAWNAKYDALLNRVADVFWPRWDTTARGGPAWRGRAKTHMTALTDADMRILPALMKLISNPVGQMAKGAAPLATASPHLEWFRREDGAGEPWAATEYLTAEDRAALRVAANRAGVAPFDRRLSFFAVAHCTAPTLPMKDAIQRPRPFQVASMRGQRLPHYYAPGAVTSALPSGHGIQGVMGVCGALMELWPSLVPTPGLLDRLAQYSVDVGDRRVMAGVHYPSDNLSSWCLALSLCDELYGPCAVEGRRFLVRAIREHSVVYRALVDSGEQAFKAGLAWLEELT